MKPKIEHIVFDLDHTLWDYDRAARETLGELFEMFGLHIYTDIAAFWQVFRQVNQSLWQAYNQGKLKQDELRKQRFLQIFAKLGVPLVYAAAFSEAYVQLCPHKPYTLPFAHETLQLLQSKGYRLHVLTNGFADVQFTKLQAAGLLSFFDEVVTSCRAKAAKPQPAAFRALLRYIGSHAHGCLMVGDNLEADVRGAERVGMQGLWFNPHQSPVPQGDSLPVCQIDCLRLLPVYLQAWASDVGILPGLVE